MNTRCIFLACALATGLSSAPAGAQTGPAASERARYEARTLADEGQALFDARDYAGAIARLREADARFPAPTIKLAMAEAHEKLGQLLEARALYAQIAAGELDRSAPSAFREAKEGAAAAVARLDRAIPRVAVEVVGTPPPVLSITLDGAALSVSGGPAQVNPGKHTLTIEMSGQAPETKPIELKERETRHIQIRWSASRPAPVVITAPPPRAEPAGRSAAAPAIAFGVGGAGLVTGAIAGGLALSKMEDFRRVCGPELACRPSLAAELDGAKIAGHVSTVGFAVAGAGAALGVLLLVVPARSGAAKVGVSPTGIVVTGSF